MQSGRFITNCLFTLPKVWPAASVTRTCSAISSFGRGTHLLDKTSSLSSCIISNRQITKPVFQQERFYRTSKPLCCSKETDTKKTDPIQETNAKAEETIDANPEPEGILARFKNTYKRHGKICLAVHLVTSSVWAGSFYYMVVSGVDIINLMEYFGIGQTVIEKMSNPAFGQAASTYLLYKLASPVRYMVTIAGTRLTVKFLQRRGKMPAIPEENKISSLLKEGGVNIPKSRGRKFRRSRD